MKTWFIFCAMTLLLTEGRQAVATNSLDKQIWFGGEDPVTIKDKHRSGPGDFMALFDAHSPWQQAASGLTVFKISMQFASAATDAELSTVIKALDRRGIALALETGMLRNDRGCGKGEGYIPQDLLNLALKRIQTLGGRLDYIAMDEVVFFGREKRWPDQPKQVSCEDTIEELVNEVMESAALIHRYFPHAKIGAVEPITTGHDLDMHQLLKDYMAFADLYNKKVGAPLAFLHADIAWRSKNWMSGIAPLKAALSSRAILFGVIIGGNPDYTDDVSWTAAGLDELKTLVANPVTAPQQVIIQSWQPFPTRYLPETAAGTSTWMLLRAETLLGVSVSQSRIYMNNSTPSS